MQEEFSQKTPSSRIILLTVVIALIFAAGILIGYYYSQQTKTTSTSSATPTVSPTATSTATTSPTATATTDETADWKTYENTIYNYSIKYPDPIFRINKDDSATIQFAYKDQASGTAYSIDPKGDSSVVTSVFETKNISLEKYIEGIKSTKTKSSSAEVAATLGGRDAKKITSYWKEFGGEGYPKGTKEISVIVELNSKIYDILYVQQPSQKDYENQYNLMLSTFKFTP